jgi:serine/threonine-protein kinase RsbW
MSRPESPPPTAAHAGNPNRFECNLIAADSASAAQTRTEFSNWLQRHFTLDADRFSDIMLAVNEAVANAAEHAYIERPKGTIDVQATYDVDADALLVTILDRGHWRQNIPEPATVDRRHALRGRGIPLMHMLADEATIDSTPSGTEVTLKWANMTGPLK